MAWAVCSFFHAVGFMSSPKHIWRSDITGLRALAVIPVLIYHAWPQVMPGGFVGVDIFFVISGYLISGILFRELLQKGKIDYFNFYAKRIRRIIPNLLCVLTFTFVVGWFFLVDGEFKSLGKQIYSSILFCQNFRLLTELGDYFADSATRQPLLHLWSLAIEEQFYIVFPILCTLIWKFTRSIRLLGGMVLVIVLGSLIGCFSVKDPATRFYFPLTRFWELGAGILLAYAETMGHWSTERFSSISRHCISLLGGGLVICALIVADANTFPNFTALMPVAGAVLMIAASPNSIFNRALAWQPVVFVGLISYSLYLWHWPLIAYNNIMWPDHPSWLNAVVLLLAFLISVFMYRYVETPSRLVAAPKQKRLIVCLTVGMVAAFSLGQVARRVSSYEGRLIGPVQEWQARLSTAGEYLEGFSRLEVEGATVYLSRKDRHPDIWMIGDSHVEQYAPRAKWLADRQNRSVGVLMAQGCLIAPGVIASSERCQNANFAYLKILDDPKTRKILWGQKWGSYLTSWGRDRFSVRVGNDVLPMSAEMFDLTLAKSLDLFESRSSKVKFYILLDAPWDEESGVFHPLHCLKRFPWEDFREESFIVPAPRSGWWRKGNAMVEAKFTGRFDVVDPSPLVCPNGSCSLLHYLDDDHLAPSYVKDQATWIDSIFNW